MDLSDEEIGGAFEALDAGSKGGVLNPMQFSNLLRMMDASQGNLKMELDLFHEFDSRNAGAITLDDFTSGIRRVVAAKGLKDAMVSLRVDTHRHRSRVGCGSQVSALLDGIRAYHEKGMVAL